MTTSFCIQTREGSDDPSDHSPPPRGLAGIARSVKELHQATPLDIWDDLPGRPVDE